MLVKAALMTAFSVNVIVYYDRQLVDMVNFETYRARVVTSNTTQSICLVHEGTLFQYIKPLPFIDLYSTRDAL